MAEARYDGEYNKDGKRHGQGIHYFADGDRYEGEHKDDKWHGQGIFYQADGSRYEGEFKDGKSHGQGIFYSLANGEFKGEWKDGKRHGQGIYYHANGNRHEGEYKDGKCHGQGIFYFLADNEFKGDRYEGEFKDSKYHYHGQGIYYRADGSRYEGEFKDSKYHGQGIYYHADGDRHEGEWKDGKRHGQGINYHADGRKESGTWENNTMKTEGHARDISADHMEDLAVEVCDEKRPLKARRKYNDFMRDLQDAILASAAMPTRRKQLMDIKEYMDEMNPSGGIPSTAPRTASTRPIPVASQGPSDIETRFSKLRHMKADGGMAEVYLARDNNSGSDVIWKQAAPDTKRTLREVNSAIDREAEILQELSHNRIPRYIDSGEVLNQRREKVRVLIMEHLDGQSLDVQLRSAISMGHRHSLDQTIATLSEVCEALEYMADLDPPVYHRDLKPHNIIMHPERGTVLIDFGMAKGVEAGSGRSLSGGDHTAGWAPPERANGETDSTTDVYGLGQLLYHILTHQPAGIYPPDARLSKIAKAGQPEWAAYLVNMATVPDSPSKRIQSVLEFRMRLQNENSMD